MNSIYLFLYIIRFLIVGVALGIVFINASLFKMLKPFNKFIFGMTLTPVVLSFVSYICALLWIGIPRLVIFTVPIITSLLYLLWKRNYKILLNIKHIKKGKIDNNREAVLIKVIIIGLLLVLSFYLIQIFNSRLHRDLYGSDESHYITQSRIFYEERNSWEIDNYKGKWEGTVFSDDHGPLWPVYLADAAMIEDDFNINAIEIKTAYLLTIICMLIMIVNVGNIISEKISGGICALYIYMLYHLAIHFPLAGSRDAYRMIALLSFFVVLYGLSLKLHKDKYVSYRDCLLLSLFSYLSMNGHEGNIFIMLSASIAFFVFEFFSKIKVSEIISSAFSILIGTLLCFIKNVCYYLNTGRFITTSIRAFEGTEAAKITLEHVNDSWSKSEVASTFTKSDRWLVAIGLTAILFFAFKLVYDVIMKKHEYKWGQMYAVYLVIAFLIPMTGVFNFLGYNVSLYFLAQMRYRMYFFVFLALIGGLMLSEMLNLKNKSILIWGVRIFTVYIALIGIHNLKIYYPRSLTDSAKGDLDLFKETAREAVSKSTGGDIFVGEQIAAAYFKDPPKLLFDYYAKPILTAENEDEVEAALDDLNAQVFVINWRCDDYHYDVLPFYNYLQTSGNVTRKFYENNGRFTDIYIVDEKIWR